MATLSENITQAIHDFDDIKDAIIEKGIEVPEGTATHEYSEKIKEISGLIPSGSIEITQNGDYDVSSYALADVNVAMPSGTVNIAENGIHDVNSYSYADVNVPETNPLAKTIVGTDIETLIIPSGITEIASHALENRASLVAVSIPSGVLTINDFAFHGCTNLETVILPSTVVTIGQNAFSGCPKLKNISFYEGLEDIQAEAFKGASSLTNDLVFPSTLRHIGENAFSGCNNFTHCNIVDLDAWYNVIIDGPTGWYDGLYLNGELVTSLVIPETVTAIEDYAFGNCNFTSIVIPDSVESIGTHAFSAFGLLALSIGSGLQDLDDEAFGGHNSLPVCTSLIVDPNNTVYDSRDNCNAIIETATNKLIIGCASTVIPNSVTTIGAGAFQGCHISSVVIPDSVTTIEESAFRACTALHDVTLPSGITELPDRCFASSGVYDVVIPEGVTYLGKNCFGYSKLGRITLPSTLQIIDDNCFRDCYYLGHTIEFPEGLLKIGKRAFDSHLNLYEFVVPDSVISIGESAFFSSDRNSCSNIALGKNLMSIGEQALYVNRRSSSPCRITVDEENEIYASRDNCVYTKDMKKLVFGNQYTSYDTAFAGIQIIGEHSCHNNAQTIHIPNTVISIEPHGMYAIGLTTLIVGSGLRQIGVGAFQYCSNLTNVKYIGTEEDWNNIQIDPTDNDYLLNASIEYNYVGE